MKGKDRERTLENIARLKRAEKTSNVEIAIVREDLESQLGGTVPRSLAARLLGVSHTGLNKWIAAGDIPVVITEAGRREIPIPVLLELQERVADERRSGRRKLHTLEPAMIEARQRARRIRPKAIRGQSADSDEPHGGADARSLAYHQVLAPRLRRPAIEEAERRLRRWRDEGKIDPRNAKAWEDVFGLPMTEIRKAITAEGERGRNLRQNSPLAGLLSEPERRRILEAV